MGLSIKRRWWLAFDIGWLSIFIRQYPLFLFQTYPVYSFLYILDFRLMRVGVYVLHIPDV